MELPEEELPSANPVKEETYSFLDYSFEKTLKNCTFRFVITR